MFGPFVLVYCDLGEICSGVEPVSERRRAGFYIMNLGRQDSGQEDIEGVTYDEAATACQEDMDSSLFTVGDLFPSGECLGAFMGSYSSEFGEE